MENLSFGTIRTEAYADRLPHYQEVRLLFTSLALALALSAEIQLKGTAPLELFFLDEGFGSLDDMLLDIVMESLEKIHNDHLKSGDYLPCGIRKSTSAN